jgi:hypothetical protein
MATNVYVLKVLSRVLGALASGDPQTIKRMANDCKRDVDTKLEAVTSGHGGEPMKRK